MVYKKRFYKKRYYKKKTLKKSNIFRSKSAKSQAKQIFALNKKINNVYKNIKPETCIYDNYRIQGFNMSFQGDTTQTYQGRTFQKPIFKHCIGDGTTPFVINGNLLRIYNTKLQLNFHRNATASAFDWAMRITILKMRKFTDLGNMEFIHQGTRAAYDYNTNNNDYNNHIQRAVYGPLNDNITTYGKIILDKKYKVKGGNDALLTKNINYTFKRNVLRKNETLTGSDIPGGEYLLCVTFGFIPYDDSAGNISESSLTNFSLGIKIAYIDELEGDTRRINKLKVERDGEERVNKISETL